MVNELFTDENGTCTITGVEKGSLTVKVSKKGYVNASKSVDVTGNTTLDIILEEETVEETVNIKVNVTDGETPVKGASVSLLKNDETIVNGTTGSAGGCTLSNVPLDNYAVLVTATGYENYESTISVTSETSSLTVTMVKKTTTP